MEIHFKNSHATNGADEITPNVTGFAQRKLLALKKHLNKGNHVAQVYVELGKVSEAHQNGNYWRSQINMDVKGQRYHADATAEHIQGAIEKSVKELEAEVRKSKEKKMDLFRKGGAAIKSFMKGSNGISESSFV